MFGNIHKIIIDKGFAFAEGDDKRDYFIHWSALQRSSIAFRNLEIGMRMEFDAEENEDKTKAPRAINVKWTGDTVKKSTPVIPTSSTIN